MKGFPNQIAELEKLARGMRALSQLADQGARAKDDAVFGEALVRAGVLGTGHIPQPVEEYLREQRTKPRASQSFQTSARGLRELFRLFGFIDDSDQAIVISSLGRQAATFADAVMDEVQTTFWRRIIRNVRHHGGDTEASHPYQVLLRLVARKPGITRAKTALALEARNDSQEELDRIVQMTELSEAEILREINVTKSNWDNAKKVLPKFAEQLHDVYKEGQLFYIADAPGRGSESTVESTTAGEPIPPAFQAERSSRRVPAPRAPRSSRAVTPDTIGQAGTAEGFDEVEITPEIDPNILAEAIRQRRERLRRHNLLVRQFAARLREKGAALYENPFDVFGVLADHGILAEIKSLDGSPDDERDRVRDALGQLLYYEAFVTQPVAGNTAIRKVACFEQRVSEDHMRFLNASRIGTIWKQGDQFAGDDLAVEFLGHILEELR